MNSTKAERATSRPAATESPGHQLLPLDKHHQSFQKALRLIREDQNQKALEILNSCGQSPAVQNARGICLMRLGSKQSALNAYRSYILQTGGAWARPDVPVTHVLNFATALLLNGHPSGCLELLGHLKSADHPGVQRLRQAIRDWERSLSLWARFNWRFGRIEPDNAPVTLSFVPGELEDEERA